MTPAPTATYLYCAVQGANDPLRGGRHRPLRGLPGAGPLRALDAGGGVWLVASAAPLDQYGAEAIDARLADLDWVSKCAVAHDAVVEHFARTHPVIPMKLFTLFTSEDRAREHVSRARRKLGRLFARVADRQEWGVRMLLDERRALPAAESPITAPTGRAFLQLKKAAKDARQRVVADALTEADAVYAALDKAAEDSRRRMPSAEGPVSRMVLDAAFLVKRGEARRFKAAVAEAARSVAARGLTLSLTGPWPPYHFVVDEP